MSLKRNLGDEAFQPVGKKPVLTSIEQNITQNLTFKPKINFVFKRKMSEDLIQPMEKKIKTYNPNCTAGVIQKIKLENFMCHSELTLKPNANINFVTGANGAGKSSILQALVLGLGGDSKHTKRYTNLASFIKKVSF